LTATIAAAGSPFTRHENSAKLASSPELAPQFLALLKEAGTFWGNEFVSDTPIDGSDLVE